MRHANPPKSPNETRIERWLDRVVVGAMTPRGAAVLIATVSTVLTIVSGIMMTVADRKHFPSIGSGLWWAVQTVTTVGYGDRVPETVAGQLVAALVMLVGVGFLTVITASITSTFVARSRREQEPEEAVPADLAEQFRQIDARLERIESALTGR